MRVHRKLQLIALVLACFESVSGSLNFGGTGSCSGQKSKQQIVDFFTETSVFTIPSGYTDLEVTLTSSKNLDLRIKSGDVDVVKRWTGLAKRRGSQTVTYAGDSLTYSGFGGDGTSEGNEYVRFQGTTKNSYTVYIFALQSDTAMVVYSWTGSPTCTPVNPSGQGSFSQYVSSGSTVSIGSIPQTVTDLYFRLDGSSDVDIILSDGSTNIISSNGGVLNGPSPSSTSYGGVTVAYSGYNGEQRSGTLGQESFFLSGSAPSTWTVQLVGKSSGTVTVKYRWGFYASASGKTGTDLKNTLTSLISGHTQLSYSQCWTALQRTDQDNSNSNNVIGVYSQKSIPKASQDNGCSCPDFWNREHTWPNSHGNFGTSAPAGTDIHHLRAEDKSVNEERAEKDFAVGGSQLSDAGSRSDCPTCLETSGTFEPPNAVKGMVARGIFYMATRYSGTLTIVSGQTSTGTPGKLGDLATLKQWNSLYPPTAAEYHRNGLVYEIQGTRNPYIDHPEYVNAIF